ncbi:unnamed protein product [Cyclocybe aegerita]|uniref:Nephrocystin 3-like N-terminal domain-containing protein n=1 Tax=Cyclocybe aegerita TaxID=1973307 RepID=A0A8S0VVE8_CYCAE|nr:unnamed protein product [Cyclocybe aegerita]
MEWVTQHQVVRLKPLLWLYGAAGAGKSAICRTIAERCYGEGLLVATFFSRTSLEHNSVEGLLATLAYQLALSIPSTRDHVQKAVENDPSIFERDLDEQFEKLIAQPVLLSLSPQGAMQHYIFTTIISTLSRHNLPLIFLISSRSEFQILTAFNSPEIDAQPVRIPLDNLAYQSEADIRLFLLDKFAAIRNTHPLSAFIPSTWPSAQVIDQLVLKSSGQFIYVSTVMKYVESPQHRPLERLQVVLGASKFIFDSAAPFAELDSLYLHILSSVQNAALTKRILGVLTIGEFPSMEDGVGLLVGSNQDKLRSLQLLCDLLFIGQEDLYLVLNELRSLISVQHEAEFSQISVLHASLCDFLSDPFQSGNLHIKASEVHTELALACIHIFTNVGNGVGQCHSLATSNYARRNIFLHCRFGDPTDHLLFHLRQFDLPTWLSQVSSDEISGIYTTLLDYLSWLKSLRFEGLSETLYTQHLRAVDQSLNTIADKVPPGGELFELLACWVVGLDMNQPSILPFSSLWKSLVDFKAGYDVSQFGAVDVAFWHVTGFGNIARDWFGCPDRAGKRWGSTEVYARASLQVIRSLYHTRQNTENFSLDASMEVWFLFKILPGLLEKVSCSQELVANLQEQRSFSRWIEQRFSNTPHYIATIRALGSYCRQQEVEMIEAE